MKTEELSVAGIRFPVHRVNTLVIGSGAASLNTAVQLWTRGVNDILLMTDRWGGGTSGNAGSDKQTYYKLSLDATTRDSAVDMARDLCSGGSMHGDIALCEAQNSLSAFFHLVQLGLPFPCDRYGAYPGYITDHDRKGRATSAGPLTSQMMVKILARRVEELRIPVLDRHPVVALLHGNRDGRTAVVGALALDTKSLHTPRLGFVIVNARNIVLGTGGPGGLYRHSVYPHDQTGAIGLALAIGASAQNLTESQFGLASLSPRWNLSGSYQQVIPRYFSTTAEGGEQKDFLNDYFPDMKTLADATFLKGYQWPFDPVRISGSGSSLIDFLVYRERIHGDRRVFIDYTRNPVGDRKFGVFSLKRLDDEALTYLKNSAALAPLPVERLLKLNPEAYHHFSRQGIDLAGQPLEIDLCAQHNNGGLTGNIWWESSIKHLFPVGEVNGSHGVYRPGGSALNSGQVGGMRAAAYIAARCNQPAAEMEPFSHVIQPQLERHFRWAQTCLGSITSEHRLPEDMIADIQKRISVTGAAIRFPRHINTVVREAWKLFRESGGLLRIHDRRALPKAFLARDLCLTHAVYLEAIQEYIRRGGASRGSFIIIDATGQRIGSSLESRWKYRLNQPEDFVQQNILELSWSNGKIKKKWLPPRDIPMQSNWFENLWQAYRDDKIYQ